MRKTKMILAGTLALACMNIGAADFKSPLKGRNPKSECDLTTMAKPMLGQTVGATRTKMMLLNAQGTPLEAADNYTPAPRLQLRSETFSKEIFQYGSYGDPDFDVTLIDPNYMNNPYPAWFNLLPECMEDGEIWGGHYLYPAGGMACLVNIASYNIYESNIVVPVTDCSAEGYEGIVHVRFKACLEAGKPKQGLVIQGAETNNMSPSWDVIGEAMAEVQDEWMVYDVAFYGGRESVILNIYNCFGNNVYIDDIEVYQEGQIAMTPKLLPHSNYKGETWTANWEAAPGAESYLLDIYSVEKQYDPMTGQPTGQTTTFLKQNEPVAGAETNHYDVTGAVSGQKYFYTVRSVKGDFVSSAAPAMVVNELVPTQMQPVANLAEEGYTATWNSIPGADVYNYWASFERTADKDGEFVITNEDFNGVVDGEGFETGWTKEDPESQCYPSFSYSTCKQAGWIGYNTAPYTDYIALDVWQYIYGGTDSGYLSPELDLSKDNGKAHLSIDLAANLYEGEDEDGNYVSGYPRACVAVFNYNKELNDFEQTEIHYINDVNYDWQTFTVDLTTCTDRCIVGIYGVYAPENIYLDNLYISQNYKNGETFRDPYYFGRYNPTNEIEVNLPRRVLGSKLYHQVCGVKAEIDETSMLGALTFLESPKTPIQLVEGSDTEEWAGVETPSYAKATVQIADKNKIYVQNPDNMSVKVYNLSGVEVYGNESGAPAQTITLDSGCYIVKVGKQTVKVVL